MVAIDSDDASHRADYLAGNKTNLAATTAQIEHGVPWLNETTGIAASIVTVEHILRDNAQVFGIIGHRATQSRLQRLSGSAVTVLNGNGLIHDVLLGAGLPQSVARKENYLQCDFRSLLKPRALLSYSARPTDPITNAPITPAARNDSG